MDIDHLDSDLREQLDRSFGDGPTHLPLDARLAAGHRALLRRRIGTGLVTAAVVIAVIGTTFAVAGGDDRATREPGYAASDSSVATEPSVSPEPSPIPWRGEFVRYDRAGEVEVRPGAEVLERIENPYGHELPRRSVGLTVSWKDKTYWVLLETRSSMTTPADPEGAWSNLGEWVAEQVALDSGAGSEDEAADFPGTNVRFDDSGRLVADEGYRVVEQRTDVDMPDSFAPAGATTAVALVEGPGGERTWWLGRITDGFEDYIPYDAEPGQTVEQFLVFARGKYDAGVGLR